MKNTKIGFFFTIFFMLCGGYLTAAATGGYSGSHAYNHSNLLNANVNTSTGTFHFSYPLIKTAGMLAPFTLSLTYKFNYTGMFGLPKGWQFDLDYILEKTAHIGGKQWLIDPLWHDETGYASGLKYYNQHGSHFEDTGTSKEIPSQKYTYYRYKFTHKDGSIKYFSHQGLLVFEIDRFDNKISIEYLTPVTHAASARVKSITDNYGNIYRFDYEPNSIIVRYPDDREQHIYFNKKGITQITTPLKHDYKISYTLDSDQNLIRSIETPAGLIMKLTYDSIPYKYESSIRKMPVVINFKQYDKASNETHHEAYYSYSPGNNYTGYPNYSLSSSNDNLMDSNNQAYKYSVGVKVSNGATTNPVMHEQVYHYNYLHLPVEIHTKKEGLAHIKTTNTYTLSPFKYSRSTNYDKPAEVIKHIWQSAKNTYLQSDKTTHSYDSHGNKIKKSQFVFNQDNNSWVAINSLRSRYYTTWIQLRSA